MTSKKVGGRHLSKLSEFNLLKSFKFLKDGLDYIIRLIVIIIMMITVPLVFIQVLLRFTIGKPFTWAEELTRYLFILLTMITLGPASEAGKLIGIEFVLALLPEQTQKIIKITVKTISIILCILISYYGIQLVILNLKRGQLSPALQLPIWIPYSIIPIGLIILAIYNFFQVCKIIRKESGVEE